LISFSNNIFHFYCNVKKYKFFLILLPEGVYPIKHLARQLLIVSAMRSSRHQKSDNEIMDTIRNCVQIG